MWDPIDTYMYTILYYKQTQLHSHKIAQEMSRHPWVSMIFTDQLVMPTLVTKIQCRRKW